MLVVFWYTECIKLSFYSVQEEGDMHYGGG